jgi:hypothetical protein
LYGDARSGNPSSVEAAITSSKLCPSPPPDAPHNNTGLPPEAPDFGGEPITIPEVVVRCFRWDMYIHPPDAPHKNIGLPPENRIWKKVNP